MQKLQALDSELAVQDVTSPAINEVRARLRVQVNNMIDGLNWVTVQEELSLWYLPACRIYCTM